MARTRVRWGRVGALLAVSGVALTVAASAAQAGGASGGGHEGAARPERVVAVRHYVVRPGDTLWGIAARLAGPRQDPRPVLDALLQANDLGGTLAPGTRLVVPRSP